MTILDAYALIAFLIGGPAAASVRAILREGDAAVATANLAETLDISQRRFGLPVECAMAQLEPLLAGPLQAAPLGCAIALRAAELRSRHCHRSQRPISLADAVLPASASSGDRIATADSAVLALARAERLPSLALPELNNVLGSCG